jgi:benzylsuccinate CoA-transferase BbsF subunit
MPRLGLGYEDIKKIKPNIIYVSSSACGQTGPEGKYKGYAPNFAALAGVDHMTGYHDGMPSSFAASIDVKSAMTCTFAILTALVHLKETGEGQFIDVSSTASISSLIGDVLLDYILTGENPMRQGNRNGAMAPHNCYRCSGEDKWVAIAVGNEQELRSLFKAMGRDDLVADESFSENSNRLKNQNELDRIIGEWTMERENDEIMNMLQKRGVAATLTHSSESLFNDPHIRELGLFEQIDHHTIGKTWVIQHPWKFSETPPVPNRAAPKLGEHNDEILQQLLGLAEDRIAELKTEKVLF